MRDAISVFKNAVNFLDQQEVHWSSDFLSLERYKDVDGMVIFQKAPHMGSTFDYPFQMKISIEKQTVLYVGWSDEDGDYDVLEYRPGPWIDTFA